MRSRRAAWVAGAIVAVCVSGLSIDGWIAARRAPVDARQILELQRQTKSDASFAPRLSAEEKRITVAKQTRKSRDSLTAWLLIASASVFLYSMGGARRFSPPMPVRRSSRPEADPGRKKPAPQTPAPETDLTFVDELVARLGRAKESTIPLLQAIQNHYRYLPDEALRRVCELTEITPAEIAGTSSFYARFRRSPVGEHVVRVCHGTACHVAGARQITEELRRYLAIPEGSDTDAACRFTIDEVACVGCCSLAPMLMVDGHPAGNLTPASACDSLQELV